MMKTVICFAVFITIAYAVPNTDSVVPEVEMLQVNAFQEAHDYVTELLQDGKDEGACADLAAATIKEVQNEVATQQKILDSLDTGSDCPNKGQAAVDSAQSTLDQANKDKSDAEAAAASAVNAPVNIAPKSLSGLTPGECAPFFTDPAYVAAVAARDAAKAAAAQAAGAVTGAQAGLKAAQDVQKEAIKECQCAVRAAYEKAWAATNANNDENAKVFTKGEHMKCVLAGTSPGDCQVGDIPKVSAIKLAAGVPESQCTEAPTPVPTPQPTPGGTSCGKMHKAPAHLQTFPGWTICYLDSDAPAHDKAAQCKTLLGPNGGHFGCWIYWPQTWSPYIDHAVPSNACEDHRESMNKDQNTAYTEFNGFSHYLVACIKN